MKGFRAFVVVLVALAALPSLALGQPALQNNQVEVYYSFVQIGRAADLSVGTTSANEALGNSGPTVVVYNIGANFAYVNLSKTAAPVATVAAGVPVPPHSCVALSSVGQSYIAAITATGTTTLQVAVGTGVPGSCGVSAGATSPLPITGNTNIPTYSASASFANSSAGDAFCVYGSATYANVNVKGIRITATASAQVVVNTFVIRRSTQDVGGGATTITPVASDSNNPAATASAVYYTTAPTPGTTVGHVRDRFITVSATATNVVSVSEALFQFSPYYDQPQVLHGTTQGICVSVPATAGGTWSIDAEWTESN